MFTGNMDHMRSWWKEEHCPYCLSFLIRRIYFIVSIKISSLSYTSLNFWTLSVVIKQNSNKPRTIIVAAERQKSDLCPNQAATQQTKGLCEYVYVIYIEHLHPSVSSSHSSLCAPLPLRLTSSSTAATTIFVSRTSSSLPACKTRRHPLTWTSKHPTLQTAKRRHPRTHSETKATVSVIPHTMRQVYTKVAHIMAPFTTERVFVSVLVCMLHMWINLFSTVLPAVRYLHGSIMQTSCQHLLTD